LNDLIDTSILGFYSICSSEDSGGYNHEDKERSNTNTNIFSLDYFCAKYLLSSDMVKYRKISATNVRKKLVYARNVSCSGPESFPEGCYDSKYFSSIQSDQTTLEQTVVISEGKNRRK